MSVTEEVSLLRTVPVALMTGTDLAWLATPAWSGGQVQFRAVLRNPASSTEAARSRQRVLAASETMFGYSDLSVDGCLVFETGYDFRRAQPDGRARQDKEQLYPSLLAFHPVAHGIRSVSVFQ